MSDAKETDRLDTLMCYNVYALHRAFSRFYQAAFSDTGFTYPKYIVLMALKEGGPMSLNELSGQVGTEANSLSPMVKKMGAFGLIDRVRDPADERRVMLTLLPYGETVLEQAQKVVEAGWSELGFDADLVEQTNAALKSTRTKLDQTVPTLKLEIPDKE